ncbi:hypothetical protein [Caldicellulosiruptor morganii]|uniref:hypothetical protein n=1 Tax=Caldicellulosiruptor morganii TaxID=1387555 RepID=UPI0005EB9F7E|nr:hypothetical protein [Caldicellulosiruptor morganii]
MKKKLISIMYTLTAMLYAVPALATDSTTSFFKNAGVSQKDPAAVAGKFIKEVVAPIAAIAGLVGLTVIAVWFFAKIMTAKDARERSEVMSNFSWKLIGAIGLCLILTVGGFLYWLVGKIGNVK